MLFSLEIPTSEISMLEIPMVEIPNLGSSGSFELPVVDSTGTNFMPRLTSLYNVEISVVVRR